MASSLVFIVNNIHVYLPYLFIFYLRTYVLYIKMTHVVEGFSEAFHPFVCLAFDEELWKDFLQYLGVVTFLSMDYGTRHYIKLQTRVQDFLLDGGGISKNIFLGFHALL